MFTDYQEDLPPHIFAAAQLVYHSMLALWSNQLVVLINVSSSGKINVRILGKMIN